MWLNVVKAVTELQFDITVTMTDGHKSNVRLFKEKLCGGFIKMWIPNPLSQGNRIYMHFDPTHLFKNIYNNFRNKENFICPSMVNKEETDVTLASFAHIRELFGIEKGKRPKMAHKLSEKVINPFSVEKTNVRLADACFHESTIKALEYFGDHGYPHFSPTAEILQVIRNWWNIMNVKSRYIGINKRDRKREEIDDENCESIQYLRDVADWFESWHSQNPSNGLTRETFHAVKHTTLAMIELVQYLLNTKNEINFVLLGLIQSDFLEGRFGWYRQLNGGNYYASVLQFLQAEKTIRLRSLVEFGYNMSAIDAICSEVKENEV